MRQGLLRFVGEEGRKQREKLRPEDGEAHEHDGEAVELEALAKEEQELAFLQIQEMHPLAGTSLATAFPVLCCCLRPCSSAHAGIDPESAVGQKLAETARATDGRLDRIITTADAEPYGGTAYVRDMEKKFGLQRRQSRKKNSDDHKPHGEAPSPLADLGFGITSWLATLRFLFWLYVVLSVFAGAIMMYYKSFGALDPNRFSAITQFSLGNVGFTESLCFFQYADIKGEQSLKCHKGTLSALHFLGMLADSTGR